MSRPVKPLTDRKIQGAKPKPKAYKLTDGQGLYLEIAPGGGKWWRLKYRFGGKEKRVSLGVYPDVGLKDARDRREAARRLLAEGIDPSQARQDEKAAAAADTVTFEKTAREWYEKFRPGWRDTHARIVLQRLEKNIFPAIGTRPVQDIQPPELLRAIRMVENRGAVETARRVLQVCGQIFRYAVASGLADRDPSADLKGALPPCRATHFASVTDPKDVAGLLRAIDGYSGSFIVRCALKLAPLTFVRPGELRHAEWAEIDFDESEWRIPGHKMKMAEAHVVPLPRQAVAVLRELHPLTGHGKYIFPSMRSTARCMSENTVNAALRRLGYAKDEMTGHGFRSMASTILNEQGWPSDAIERQLAHRPRNKVRAAYNHAQHLDVRRKMMQAWADYLDGLKSGAKVVPIRATGGQA